MGRKLLFLGCAPYIAYVFWPHLSHFSPNFISYRSLNSGGWYLPDKHKNHRYGRGAGTLLMDHNPKSTQEVRGCFFQFSKSTMVLFLSQVIWVGCQKQYSKSTMVLFYQPNDEICIQIKVYCPKTNETQEWMEITKYII